MLVAYTDDTLIATRKRSPLDRSVLARALAALDGMGAKAIGVDILIDQPQDEDPEPAGRAQGDEDADLFCLRAGRQQHEQHQLQSADISHRLPSLALRAARSTRRACISKPTSDGVIRRWEKTPASLPPRLVVAMAKAGASRMPMPLRISKAASASSARRAKSDRSIRRCRSTSLPIPQMAQALAGQVRGKYVLVGGDILDIDQFETPLTRFSRVRRPERRKDRARAASPCPIARPVARPFPAKGLGRRHALGPWHCSSSPPRR